MTSLRKDVPESFDPGELWMQKMMEMKGLITDFHQLYLVRMNDNDRPFDKAVKTVSNDLVDEWYERCLVPNKDNLGKMTSQEVNDRWFSFYEAMQTRLAMKYWDLGFHPTKEQTDKWLELFDGDIEKLASLGVRTVRDGFSILIAAYDDWFVKEKYNRCFENDDPDEWHHMFKKESRLFTREIEPFSMASIREKMTAIVNPQNEPGPKSEQSNMGRANI